MGIIPRLLVILLSLLFHLPSLLQYYFTFFYIYQSTTSSFIMQAIGLLDVDVSRIVIKTNRESKYGNNIGHRVKFGYTQEDGSVDLLLIHHPETFHGRGAVQDKDSGKWSTWANFAADSPAHVANVAISNRVTELLRANLVDVGMGRLEEDDIKSSIKKLVTHGKKENGTYFDPSVKYRFNIVWESDGELDTTVIDMNNTEVKFDASTIQSVLTPNSKSEAITRLEVYVMASGVAYMQYQTAMMRVETGKPVKCEMPSAWQAKSLDAVMSEL